MTEEPAQAPALRTPKELEDAVRKILTANDIKVGSLRARSVECSFIQGLMFGNSEYAKHPYLIICLISGRSILDD